VIDVALSPAELRRSDVAVVIDVLRATSTAVTALGDGYVHVVFAASLDLARDLQRAGRVLAGERHCLRPDGFDQGNSPSDAAGRRGDELVLATTNGTPAVVAATQVAPTVLIASLLNLRAVTKRLVGAGDVQFVCAGTDGAVALEDVYVAGRIAAHLPGARTDAAIVAEVQSRTGMARRWRRSARAPTERDCGQRASNRTSPTARGSRRSIWSRVSSRRTDAPRSRSPALRPRRFVTG
jgi:phosphosulfolactate phosphohydrolase-like enzyme